MNKKNLLLSAIILAKNEDVRIEDCIRSLKFCDEIIVINNGSKDATSSIATNAGARVIACESTSFAEARNKGHEASVGEWILYIDADERVSHELKESILEVVHKKAPSDRVAYTIVRKDIYLGVEFPDTERIIRFMKRSSLVTWEGKLHETAIINGNVGKLNGILSHDTHRSLTHMVDKTNAWSITEAELRFSAGHPKIVWWRIIRVMITGFYTSYISHQGWKVGTAGFIESMYQAFSMFITYAKLYELQKKQQ